MIRYEWLAEMVNENGFVFGAELGVREGTTSKYLLKNCPSLKKLVLVDLWASQPENTGPENYEGIDHDSNYKKVCGLSRYFPDKEIIIIREMTKKAHIYIADHSLDFVFIDADHGFEAVQNDIDFWWPKIRGGGILCGHDYPWKSVENAVKSRLDFYVVADLGENAIWWIRC